MSPAMSFCLLMSTLTLTWATRNATNARYKITARSDASTQAENENLKIILNYVRDEQRMYSVTVSLVYLNTRSDLVDLVSEYVASESIVSYRITTSNLSRKCSWQNRVDLMWILIVDDIDLLDFFVYEQSHIWKATNQYLIIITAESVATRELPRQIFQSIWRSYSVHRIVIVSIQEKYRCFNRYLPFEKNQQSEYGVVRKVCLVDRQDRVELYDKAEKLNGYPIRVIVFESLMMKVFNENTKNATYKGVDAEVMFLLEKAMEAKFRIEAIPYYCVEDPFNFALQQMEDGKSDLIITGYFTHEYEEYHKYEFTTSVYDDRLCLLAPASDFMPKSYMPILPFAPKVWALLAAYNLLVTILWFLIKYYSISFHRREPILLPLMAERRPTMKGLVTTFGSSRRSDLSNFPPEIPPYVLSCFDLVETLCYPLKEDGGKVGSTTAQRAFLLGTLFFGLIVTGLYQSWLVTSLSDPFRYPQLKTLEDVANSNLTIITKYENLKKSTFTENTTLAKRLRNKMKVVSSDKRTNDLVAFDKNVTSLTRFASVKLDNLSSYFDKDGNELLHIVPECPTSYLLSYIMRIYSPYRERINGLLLRMREAGLVGLWYGNMTYPMYVDWQRRKMAKSDRRIKLTLEHYSLTFLGLSLGLLCCAIVFLAELYYANRLRRRRKTRVSFRVIAK